MALPAIVHHNAATDRSPAVAVLDPHDLVHGIVEGAFSLVFPDPQARDRLHLKAISRAAHRGMAWYIWTTHRAGAYEVALIGDLADDARGSALLALRYFPDPVERVFGRFSALEQQVRRSSLFDGTGTPAFATAEWIDPEQFCIASIVLSPQGSERFTLRVEVPERWTEAAGTDTGAACVRDVPAAELALPVVDALVGAIVYLGRTVPASVRVWRRSVVGDAANLVWELELSGLAWPGGSPGYDSAFAAPMPADSPWFAHAAPTAPRVAPWPVNRRWWRAAQWQFDPVGTFCGQCAAEAAAGRPAAIHQCEHAP
jgi:hypothetical protein